MTQSWWKSFSAHWHLQLIPVRSLWWWTRYVEDRSHLFQPLLFFHLSVSTSLPSLCSRIPASYHSAWVSKLSPTSFLSFSSVRRFWTPGYCAQWNDYIGCWIKQITFQVYVCLLPCVRSQENLKCIKFSYSPSQETLPIFFWALLISFSDWPAFHLLLLIVPRYPSRKQ